MKGKRWLYLAGVVASLVALLAVGCAKAPSTEVVEWSLHQNTPYHPGLYTTDVNAKFAELCESHTNGRLKVNIYFPGDIYPSYHDMAVAVAAGEADLTYCPQTTYESLGVPEVAICSVPYAGSTYEEMVEHQTQWYSQGASGEKIQKLLEAKGVKFLGISPMAPVIFLANTKAVTEEDWSKLRLRAPSMDIYVLMVEAIGANAVPLPYSEVVMALKTGVIDGYLTDQVAYASDRMWEPGADHFPTNLIFMASAYCLFGSQKSWDNLPSDIKQIMTDKIIPEWHAYALVRNAEEIDATWEAMEGKETLYELPASRLAECNANLVETLHPKYQELDPELYAALKAIAGF